MIARKGRNIARCGRLGKILRAVIVQTGHIPWFDQ